MLPKLFLLQKSKNTTHTITKVLCWIISKNKLKMPDALKEKSMILISGHFLEPNKEQMVSPDCVLMRGASRGMGRVSVTGHDWPLMQPRIMYSEWNQILSNHMLSSCVQPRIMLTLHSACYIWLHFASLLKTCNYMHCHQVALFCCCVDMKWGEVWGTTCNQ